MQKIAIISDIHGNIAALEKVAEDIKSRQVEAVFNLGDNASGPLWPKETVEFLMKQAWVHIRGNHDRQVSRQKPENHGSSDSYAYKLLNKSELEWLATLPVSLEIDDQFLLIHGTPSNDLAYLLETIEHGRLRLASSAEIGERLGVTKQNIIFCGHTHIPRMVRLPDERLVINPGSVGVPAFKGDLPEFHVAENGSPDAHYAILEYKNGGWVTESIAVPYDHHQAVRQAHKNNQPDFEIALETGYMK